MWWNIYSFYQGLRFIILFYSSLKVFLFQNNLGQLCAQNGAIIFSFEDSQSQIIPQTPPLIETQQLLFHPFRCLWSTVHPYVQTQCIFLACFVSGGPCGLEGLFFSEWGGGVFSWTEPNICTPHVDI